MANEISVSVQVSVSNGNLVKSLGPNRGTLTIDQTTQGGPSPGYVSVGTSEESISLAELGTVGWAVLTNLDSTNYVEWGFSTGVYGGRLNAGESAALRLNPSTSLYMKANTAACKCLVEVLEA